MTVKKRTDCERCQVAPQVSGTMFCGACHKAQEAEADARKYENMRELYEAGRIELGVALCEKVAAEKEVERLRAALVESRGIMLTIAEYVGDADRSGLDEAAGEITRILNPTKPHAGEERDDE